MVLYFLKRYRRIGFLPSHQYTESFLSLFFGHIHKLLFLLLEKGLLLAKDFEILLELPVPFGFHVDLLLLDLPSDLISLR